MPAARRSGGTSPPSRLPLELRARHVLLHETTDPEVIIAEYDYDGLVTTTGRAFQVANIQVSRIRGGQITASRDYHNHPVLADAVARQRA